MEEGNDDDDEKIFQLYICKVGQKQIYSIFYIVYLLLAKSSIQYIPYFIPTFGPFGAKVGIQYSIYCIPTGLESILYCLPVGIQYILYCIGARGSLVVMAPRYKPAGRGFDSRCCHWNFSVT